MIAPAVIAAALSFWAPYSPPAGACPQGVQIHPDQNTPAQIAVTDDTVVMAWSYQGAGTCEIWTTREFDKESRARQCTYLAHEIGHTRFGLGHSTNGIMRAVDPPIPGICYPARSSHV